MLLLLHIHHIPPNSDFIIISNDEEVKKIHQYIFSFVVIKWEVIVLYGYVFFLFLFIHLRLLIIYYTTTPSETVPIINSSRSLSASSSSSSNISNEGNNIIIITAKQPSKTYVYQIFEPNHPSHYQDQSTQNQFKRNQCTVRLAASIDWIFESRFLDQRIELHTTRFVVGHTKHASTIFG